jgi:hypothetical protein
VSDSIEAMEISQHSSVHKHGSATSKPISLMNILIEFHHTLDKNRDHCVPSVFCVKKRAKEAKVPRKQIDSEDTPIVKLESYLNSSNGTGVTLDSTSVTSCTSTGASLNVGDSEKGSIVKKACTIDNNNWRSSYGNCHTICTRIPRRQSISIPRQRSLREVMIPEDCIADDDNDLALLFSQSATELFYDPTGTYQDGSTYSKWRDWAVSRSFRDDDFDDDDDDDHTEGKSVRSILSSSSRLLELPRDVEFDSSCDSSSSNGDGDDLNADFFDAPWDQQKTRHW